MKLRKPQTQYHKIETLITRANPEDDPVQLILDIMNTDNRLSLVQAERLAAKTYGDKALSNR